MRVLRGILFISFCFLWGYCTPETLNAAEKNKETLSLDTLYTLAREHVQQQVGFMYTTRLLEEARRQKKLSGGECDVLLCAVLLFKESRQSVFLDAKSVAFIFGTEQAG